MSNSIKNIDIDNISQAEDDNKVDFFKNGAYGSVQRRIIHKVEVAVKYFHKRDQYSKNYLEVVNLSECQHEYVVKLIGAGPDIAKQNLYYMIMEFAPNGSLDDLLHDQMKIEYGLEHGLTWIYQCCKAIDFMHTKFKPFLHRDLKPSNLLLFNKGRLVKLCDFGTVKNIQQSCNSVESGTFLYMAPEVMCAVKDYPPSESKGVARYNHKCDIYSVGVVLWEILTRQRPFKELNNAFNIICHVYLKKERLTDIPNCPTILQDLMHSCWKWDYEERPEINSIIRILDIFLNYMFPDGYNEGKLSPLDCVSYSRLDSDSISDTLSSVRIDVNDSSSNSLTDLYTSLQNNNNLCNSRDCHHSDENFELQLSLINENLLPKTPLSGVRESSMIYEQHNVLLKRYVHLNLDCQKLEMDNNQMLNKLAKSDTDKEQIKKFCELKIKEQNVRNRREN